ncbi:12443_t:CDS:2 [Dentiscutata erythropus]|uniref:12443_t:CDS:1 n=1 Tax=Dentiscutata erythropus TaxID=1348616 RepID=A0A9N9HME9_9GLOM|nr:12443_t:CDS:2 [Dentiscutata erythropus]
MHLFLSLNRISFLAVPAFFLLFTNVVIAQNQVVENSDQQYEFDYQNDIVAFIAITFGHINLCACLYVIYSAFKRWRASSLSISTRIPLYFGILEVCQYIVLMPNFMYSLINKQLIPGFCCEVLAYLLFLQITINMILMASIAMTTYLERMIVTIPSIRSLGPSRFWCMTVSKQANELLIDGFTIFCVTFFITCFCYLQTLSTIFNIDHDGMTDCKERMDRWNKLERKATRKILMYVVSFMIRWLLLIPFGVGVMSGHDYIWMHITAVVEHLSAFNASALNVSPKSITIPMAVFIPSIFNPDSPTFNCESIYGINSLDSDNYDGKIREKQQQPNGGRSPSDDDSSTQTDTSDIEEELYLALC